MDMPAENGKRRLIVFGKDLVQEICKVLIPWIGQMLFVHLAKVPKDGVVDPWQNVKPSEMPALVNLLKTKRRTPKELLAQADRATRRRIAR